MGLISVRDHVPPPPRVLRACFHCILRHPACMVQHHLLFRSHDQSSCRTNPVTILRPYGGTLFECPKQPGCRHTPDSDPGVDDPSFGSPAASNLRSRPLLPSTPPGAKSDDCRNSNARACLTRLPRSTSRLFRIRRHWSSEAGVRPGTRFRAWSRDSSSELMAAAALALAASSLRARCLAPCMSASRASISRMSSVWEGSRERMCSKASSACAG